MITDTRKARIYSHYQVFQQESANIAVIISIGPNDDT